MSEIKQIVPKSSTDFRKWLEKNHSKETRVQVILYKKHTGVKSPSNAELMREAICFGWIDTTAKRIDEEKYMINYTRRNSKSKWSDNTLRYAKELIKEGKMTSIGMKFYKEGLEKPTHDYGIPKNPDMPDELLRELRKDKVAFRNFEKFSPSIKRMLYRWIFGGKMTETRMKRIKLIVERAREGRKDIFKN